MSLDNKQSGTYEEKIKRAKKDQAKRTFGTIITGTFLGTFVVIPIVLIIQIVWLPIALIIRIFNRNILIFAPFKWFRSLWWTKEQEKLDDELYETNRNK